MKPIFKGLMQFLFLSAILIGMTVLAMSDSNESLTMPIPTRPKSIIKITHLGITDAGIVCLNGADPTGNKYGNVLIVSCGNVKSK